MYTNELYSIAQMAGLGCAVNLVESGSDLTDSPLHPGDTFGRICWWLWKQDPQGAVDLCAVFVRRLAVDGEFDTVLRSLLAGLPQALPNGVPAAEVEALSEAVRAQAQQRP